MLQIRIQPDLELSSHIPEEWACISFAILTIMLPMYFVQLILFFLSEGTEILDLLGLQTILLDPDCISDRMVEKCQIRIWYSKKIGIYTVRKEMKCSGETVILVITRISSWYNAKIGKS